MAEVHDIRIHALRHSHASLLISMGTNALLIKERLGHEDVQTTLGTYGHLYPSSSTEIANELKGIVNVEFTNQNMASEVTNQFTKGVKIKCDKSVITQKKTLYKSYYIGVYRGLFIIPTL